MEDNDVIQLYYQAVLDRAGYKVLMAHDGREGLNLYKEQFNQIALVLLDLSMPNMSGEEVFNQIQQFNPDARIVISSGYAPEHSKFEAAAAILEKPVRADELVSTIHRALMN